MFHACKRLPILALLLTFLSACGRSDQPVAARATGGEAKKDAAADDTALQQSPSEPEDADSPGEEQGNANTLEPVLDGMPPEPDESTVATAAQPPEPQRLMVLLSGGPLLVDLYMTIDGKDWKQAAKSGQKEASLFLDSSRSRFYEPRWHSSVWQLLDADGDGGVSVDEWQHAPERLLARDAGDDRIVYPQDLDSLRDQVRSAEGRATPMRSEASMSAARLVSPEADWQLIAAVLSDLYAFGRPLRPDDFANLGGFYAQMDADASGRLSSRELAEAANTKAHLTLEVDFASSPDAGQARASLCVVEPTDEVIRIEHVSPSRLVLAIGDEAVDVTVHDRSSVDDRAQPAGMDLERARNQMRVFAHNRGDAVLAHLDTDHDGRLGEREIAQAAGRLQSLDKNGDNRLTAGEVNGRMTFAVVRGSLPVGDERYNLRVESPPSKELRPPDWFVHGDFNGDGDISRREFIGTLDQFGQLDLNGDGFVSAKEAAVVEVH